MKAGCPRLSVVQAAALRDALVKAQPRPLDADTHAAAVAELGKIARRNEGDPHAPGLRTKFNRTMTFYVARAMLNVSVLSDDAHSGWMACVDAVNRQKPHRPRITSTAALTRAQRVYSTRGGDPGGEQARRPAVYQWRQDAQAWLAGVVERGESVLSYTEPPPPWPFPGEDDPEESEHAKFLRRYAEQVMGWEVLPT